MDLTSQSALFGALVVVASLSSACTGTAETGSVQVFAQAEASISDGLHATDHVHAEGDDHGHDHDHDIQDGWSVRYERFIVSIGNVRASRSDADVALADQRSFLLELTGSAPAGVTLVTFDEVEATRWDRFGFDLPAARVDQEVVAPATNEDLQGLVEARASMRIVGDMTSETAAGCTAAAPCRVRFDWSLPAATSFDDCASEDGLPGFAVPTGGTAQVKPTIHGDHWFFSNITAGAEVTSRYAQWIADADRNGDGETTLDELRATNPADVSHPAKYNLSGAIGGPIETAYDYLLAQARTIGDFQGDGECPTRRAL